MSNAPSDEYNAFIIYERSRVSGYFNTFIHLNPSLTPIIFTCNNSCVGVIKSQQDCLLLMEDNLLLLTIRA